FFTPLFARMQQPAAFDRTDASAALTRFLTSSRVNERTDDDKSLILATRRTATTHGTCPA
ncbi:MAG: hypothetical protein KC442_23400, partial [Thermomicrobiales bacterium]|nr:hypothetical protein [Thermomicrobiales bacterium]